jgi:hypothetical protein
VSLKFYPAELVNITGILKRTVSGMAAALVGKKLWNIWDLAGVF